MEELKTKIDSKLIAKKTPFWVIPCFFLSILFPPAYIVYLIVVVINRIRRGRARYLYHTTKNKEAFDSIVGKKILLSIAGGRLHACDELNPYLGVSSLSGNKDCELYTFLIEDENDLNKFRPIFSWKSTFHIWKWWKSLRGEYVLKERKDFSFEIKSNGTFRREIITERGVEVINIVTICKINTLENKWFVQVAQKFSFWFGEYFLSLLVFFGAAIFLNLYAMCFFGFDFLTLPKIFGLDFCFIFKNWFFWSVVLILILLFTIAWYVKIKRNLIRSRY